MNYYLFKTDLFKITQPLFLMESAQMYILTLINHQNHNIYPLAHIHFHLDDLF